MSHSSRRVSGRFRATRNSSVVIAFVASALGAQGSARATYRRATIDSSGQLRIELASRVISPPKDSAQVAFEQVALSPDRQTVGWVALYPNCCTSYPIPLRLVLLRANGRRTVIANDLPIWQWGFISDGRSVVIRQSPVHGVAATHYEQRDVLTGRVLAEVDEDSTTRRLPAWARLAMPSPNAKSPPFKER